MTIGWALLGPGRHADTNVMPQMKKADGIKLVAVLSRDRARGEAFAQKHGFARVYTTLAEVPIPTSTPFMTARPMDFMPPTRSRRRKPANIR